MTMHVAHIERGRQGWKKIGTSRLNGYVAMHGSTSEQNEI